MHHTTRHTLKSSTTAKYNPNCTADHLDFQSQCNWNCQKLRITPITTLQLPVSSLPVSRDSFIHTTTQHILKSSTTAKYNPNCTADHLDFQSQCNWNCQNFSITLIAILPLPVSISLPVPRDSSIGHNLSQPFTH
jgi:hypothetical protein